MLKCSVPTTARRTALQDLTQGVCDAMSNPKQFFNSFLNIRHCFAGCRRANEPGRSEIPSITKRCRARTSTPRRAPGF